MNIWTMWDVAKQQTATNRAGAGSGHSGRYAYRRGHKGLALCAQANSGRARATTGRMWLRAAPVWIGYRMICVGCRLARPALVADALDRF